ncbi:MAG: hypothetical protein Q4G64_09725 [bacterium]|nr:hypothetical protein [bacterium]
MALETDRPRPDRTALMDLVRRARESTAPIDYSTTEDEILGYDELGVPQ